MAGGERERMFSVVMMMMMTMMWWLEGLIQLMERPKIALNRHHPLTTSSLTTYGIKFNLDQRVSSWFTFPLLILWMEQKVHIAFLHLPDMTSFFSSSWCDLEAVASAVPPVVQWYLSSQMLFIFYLLMMNIIMTIIFLYVTQSFTSPPTVLSPRFLSCRSGGGEEQSWVRKIESEFEQNWIYSKSSSGCNFLLFMPYSYTVESTS